MTGWSPDEVSALARDPGFRAEGRLLARALAGTKAEWERACAKFDAWAERRRGGQ